MAISRVSSQDTQASVSAQTITATYPGTPTPNNLLIAAVYSATGLFTLTMSSTGWTVATAAAEITTGPGSLNVYYKIAGQSESTSVQAAQSTGVNAAMRMQIYEYTSSNATNISLFAAAPVGTVSSVGTTSLLSNSVVTTYPNALLFSSLGWGSATSARSWDNSFSSLVVSNSRIASADRIVTTAGTYSTTCSWTSSATSSLHCLTAFVERHSTGGLMGVG